LAELLAERGERDAARDLLASIYGWFTEGLNTPDLVKARTLLMHLGAGTRAEYLTRREAAPTERAESA
jgi:hypothetical protein